MCVPSLSLKDIPEARARNLYAISRITADGRPHAVLHERGGGPLTHMVCVGDGTVMTLTRIPRDLQNKFNLEEFEVVTFHASRDGIKKDVVELRRNGVRFGLAGFAGQDVQAYIGELVRPLEWVRKDREKALA